MAEKKNEKVEKGLKVTNGSFTITGIISASLDRFKQDISNGFKYRSFASNINCGDTSPRITCMGGFMVKEKYPLRFWESGSMMEIEWDDRKDTAIMEEIANYNKILVGVERDEKGGIIYKRFLNWYDAIEELKKVDDGVPVTVYGDLKFENYEDKQGNMTTNYKLEAKSIRLAYKTEKEQEDAMETFKEVGKHKDFKHTFTQKVLFESDFLNKDRFKEDKEMDIQTTLIQYDRKVKDKIPMPYSFVLKASDFKNSDVIKKKLSLFKKGLTDKNVKSVTIKGKIFGGSSRRHATLEDFSEEILEEMTDEEKEEALATQFISGEGSANFLTILGFNIKLNKKSNQFEFDDLFDEYTKEDLIYVGEAEKEVEDIDDILDDEDIDDILDDEDIDEEYADLDLD